MSDAETFAGIPILTDDGLDRDEVRLETGRPGHWVTLNLRTRRIVTVTEDGVMDEVLPDV